MLFELLDPEAGQVPVPDVDDQPGLRRRRLLHEVPGPLLLDARAGRGPERARRRHRRTRGGAGSGRGVQTSVGKGSIDWVKTFEAAKIGGVKNYFVEQNMELTKESVAFLKTMNV